MTTLTSKVDLISGGAPRMSAAHARAIALAVRRVLIGNLSKGVSESIMQNVFPRFADPDEFFAIVVLLAGDDSRFSTGGEFMVHCRETAEKPTIRLSEWQ